MLRINQLKDPTILNAYLFLKALILFSIIFFNSACLDKSNSNNEGDTSRKADKTNDGSQSETDKCKQAKGEASKSCCNFTMPTPENLKSIDIMNCVTGEFTNAQCVDTSDLPIGGTKTTETDKKEDATLGAACGIAMHKVVEECCGAKPDECNKVETKVTCGGEDGIKQAFTYLTCEEIEAFNSNGCPDMTLSGEQERLITGTTKEIELTDVAEFKEVPATEYSENPATSTTTAPNNALLNQPLENNLMKIEIPGNFLRYFAARTILRDNLQQVATSIDKEAKCDLDALECSMNPLHAPGVLEAIGKDDDSLQVDASKTTDGIKITSIKANIIEDVISVELTDAITLTADKKIKINLKEKANLKILPMHVPGNINGYGTTVNASRITSFNSVILVTGINDSYCDELTSNEDNGKYITWKQPFFCSCPTSNDPNYCVFDPYERVSMPISEEEIEENGGIINQIVCADTLKSVDSKPLSEILESSGYTPNSINKIEDKIRNFGCAGASVGLISSLQNKAVGSGIGFEFNVRDIDLGYVKATIDTDINSDSKIRLKLDFLEFAIEYLEDTWWGSFIGWIIETFKNTVEDVLMVGGTALMKMGLNTAYVDLKRMDFTTDILMSHREVDSQTPPNKNTDVSVELKRLASSIPEEPEVTDFGLGNVSFDKCDPTNSWEGSPHLIDLLLDFLGVGFCPMQVAWNVVKVFISGIESFILNFADYLFDILDILSGALFGTAVEDVENMEESNVIAKVIKNATQSLIFTPFYLANTIVSDGELENLEKLLGIDGDAGGECTGEDIAKVIPTPVMDACLIGAGTVDNPTGACQIAIMHQGSFVSQKQSFNFPIKQMGVKTHYRSMQDFSSQQVNMDSTLPPVRYCVAGDNPPDSAIYTESDLDAITDMDDIETSAQDAEKPHDWRAQCAMRIDVEAKERFFKPSETPFSTDNASQWAHVVHVIPSKRTNYVLNEIFFCENNDACNPKCEEDSTCNPNERGSIRERGELFACSMAADIWYADENYCKIRNLANPDEDASTVLSEFTYNLQNKPAKCKFSEFDSGKVENWLKTCKKKLEDAGYQIPAVPTSLVQKMNACPNDSNIPTLVTPRNSQEYDANHDYGQLPSYHIDQDDYTYLPLDPSEAGMGNH